MKRYALTALAFIFVLSLSGCRKAELTEGIAFPFEPEDAETVEMYRYMDVPAAAEKKVVTDPECVERLYDLFAGLALRAGEAEKTAGGAVTSFRFNLKDGSSYELIFVAYGVKRGALISPTGGFSYFTTADIGWNWRWLDETLEAVPATEGELPRYADGSLPVVEPELRPAVLEE